MHLIVGDCRLHILVNRGCVFPFADLQDQKLRWQDDVDITAPPYRGWSMSTVRQRHRELPKSLVLRKSFSHARYIYSPKASRLQPYDVISHTEHRLGAWWRRRLDVIGKNLTGNFRQLIISIIVAIVTASSKPWTPTHFPSLYSTSVHLINTYLSIATHRT